MMETADWQLIARSIDHTLLKPEATRDAVAELCAEAQRYGFSCVCVQPCRVPLASRFLRASEVLTATVIGFPHGATSTTVKRFEATEALRLGAQELDMVINLGALKDGDCDSVRNDIRGVAEVAHAAGAKLKAILETSLLTRDEKAIACELALSAGADFVKTSTGFVAAGGATVEDVTLMRSVVGDRAGVKAAGGIRTAADALALLKAGANRLGTSASVQIVRELGADL